MPYPFALAMEPIIGCALLVALCLGMQDEGGTGAAALAAPTGLTPWDEKLGWRSLFDGRTTSGWHAYGKEAFPDHGWSIVDGTLHHADGSGGGDLVTDEAFGDFELAFEWRVAPGANSGVKIRFEETTAHGTLGPEYQILDDAAHRDGKRPETSAGALYALYPPLAAPTASGKKELARAQEWNRARIVSIGDRIEHEVRIVTAFGTSE